MSEDIIADLLHCKTAKEIWNNLRHMSTSKNLAKVMEIRTKLPNIKKDHLSLQDYMRQIDNLIDSLKVTGKTNTTVSIMTAKSGAISPQKSLLCFFLTRVERN